MHPPFNNAWKIIIEEPQKKILDRCTLLSSSFCFLSFVLFSLLSVGSQGCGTLFFSIYLNVWNKNYITKGSFYTRPNGSFFTP
jgi:hypothetical protein